MDKNMHCHRCGQMNIKEAQICSQCGKKLKQYIPASSTKSQNVEKMQDSGSISLWNPSLAARLGILFSPAFSAYIHMKNWEVLGESAYVKSSKNWFIASILLSLLGLGFVILGAWYFAIGNKQIQYVQDKIGNTYQEKAWTKSVVIGGFIVIVVIFIPFIILKGNQASEAQTMADGVYSE